MNIKESRYNYYNKIFVLFELVKPMKDREVVFMDRLENWKCIRGLRVKTIDYLRLRLFDLFKFHDKDYNVYISCAKYSRIPPFTYDLSERSKQTKFWFDTSAKEDIISYDLLLDFDSKENRKDYLKELKGFYNLLEKEKVCFYIIFSGNNYQIVIPDNCLDKPILEDTIFINRKELATKIKEMFNLKYLDVSGVGVFNKIMKCPYSLVFDKVVLPLKKFNGNDINFNAENVLTIVFVTNRGLQLHNDFGDISNKENFNKFCKKYYLK